jgi:hypothetical protein
MSLKKQLLKTGSPLSKNNGGDSPAPGTSKQSRLHDEFSLNGNPLIQPTYKGFPKPSTLDLNGLKPKNSYDQTAPDEGIGNI